MQKTNQWLIILAFFSIYIIWGTSFLAIAYGLKGFPPFILSGLRFFIAGILLLGWLRLKGEKPFSLSAWKHNSIPGLFILTIGVGTVAWAEQYISSTEAAIVAASEPFWFILLDRKNRKYYFNNKLAIVGLLTGFAGLLIFFSSGLQWHEGLTQAKASGRSFAFLALVFSALVWVLGSLYSKKKTEQSLFMNVAQQLIIGGMASLLFASLKGEWREFRWQHIPAEAWAGLSYLILFGSILAYLSFIWLLSVKPAALVSTHTFVNPIVAVIAGSYIAGEQIVRGQLTGLSILLAGLILTNIVQYKLSRRTKVKIRKHTRVFIKVRLLPYKRIAQV